MVLQFEVLCEQLGNVSTLLSAQLLVLEHAGNIGDTQSCARNVDHGGGAISL